MTKILRRVAALAAIAALLGACALGAAGGGAAAGAGVAALLPAGAGSALSAANAGVPIAYTVGCGAVELADDEFQFAAPTLLAKGTITQKQIDLEASIAAAARKRCASPPTDLLTAGKATLQDAITLYGMSGTAVPPTLAKVAATS